MLTFAALLMAAAAQAAPADSPPGGVPAVQDPVQAPAPERQTPREVVAGLIRDAMGRPDSAATWRQLAEALPGLAHSRAAPDGSLALAASIADSTAAAVEAAATPGSAGRRDVEVAAEPFGVDPASPPPTSLPTGEAEPGEPVGRGSVRIAGVAGSVARSVDRLQARADAFPVGARLAFGGLSLVAALTLGLAHKAGARKPRRRTPPPLPAADPTSHRPLGGSALWTVRSLAANGASLAEIAQRTGMAQDTLNFMLSPAAKCHAAPDPAARPAASEELLAVSASAERPARGVPDARFRDGRLTY